MNWKIPNLLARMLVYFFLLQGFPPIELDRKTFALPDFFTHVKGRDSKRLWKIRKLVCSRDCKEETYSKILPCGVLFGWAFLQRCV